MKNLNIANDRVGICRNGNIASGNAKWYSYGNLRKYFVIAFLIWSQFSYAQVGINTSDPKSTLDVMGQSTSSSSLDGIIAPRLTGDELNLKTYTSQQDGAIVYVTSALTDPDIGQCSQVKQTGYFYFNGNNWNPFSSISYGDIKTGIQTTDHAGWIKLDGRAISTLTVTQQAQATALGIGANLPDATNSFLLQNGTALGLVSGSNTRTISQNQLPNIVLGGSSNSVSAGTPGGSISSTSAGTPGGSISGTSAGTPGGNVSVANTTATMVSAGVHTHPPNPSYYQFRTTGVGGSGYGSSTPSSYPLGATIYTTGSDGAHTHNLNPHNHTATFSGTVMSGHNHSFSGAALGDHGHTFFGVAMGGHVHTITTNSLNGGVTQQSVNITPQSLSVNTFIYLGQ